MGESTSTTSFSIDIPPGVKAEDGQLTFRDVLVAQALVGTLQLSITEAIRGGAFQPVPLDAIQPPVIDDEGWITRDALHAFFRQRYTGPRLHNRMKYLVRAMDDLAYPYYRNRPPAIEMRCTICGQPLKGECNDGQGHRAVSPNFAIKASSIIDGVDAFRELVKDPEKETRKDFELLLGALQK